jgi:hypothetical protein
VRIIEGDDEALQDAAAGHAEANTRVQIEILKRELKDARKASEAEGFTALGWFIGRTDRGATRIFTRGNEDWGPNSLLYAYPDSDVVIVVLTHAGNTGDNTTSWSRTIHAKVETALGL